MNRSLRERGRGINFDSDEEPAVPSPTPRAALPADRPRTGPGAFSASLAMGREVEAENARLRERVTALEAADVVELLDPEEVGPSEYANRDEASFATQEFEVLRAEISSAGRNVQPIKVRLLATPKGKVRYEIVFGHRRHRACLLERVRVAAVVDRLSDQELFVEMERENRARENLSPWEQGQMYSRALDKKLFPSLRRMAELTGGNAGNMSVAIQLATLPKEVVEAFPSPLDLQFRWAAPLTQALRDQPQALLARAKRLAEQKPTLVAKDVFDLLLEREDTAPAAETLSLGGKAIGRLTVDGRGGLSLKIKGGALAPEQVQRVREAIFKAIG
ncbi:MULTISPECIES: ParB/RepB/Spo0J family partition protein [Ramlibacter]|uniref:ParB/RepB/Spo0J family partition protein n=1 Tax=Ramlibacter aquaticus TaxID=2780094 RepID=A0ABR9SII2_9BURK|nr:MULTISPECIES: ParB/RepB/Spo0J family partition protein [Ramlibacter]MBE7942165.1 ParB/RepB/Spo0J family partition protein [Ramlibacter aquaticus]